MIFYRITIDLCFTDPDPLNDLKEHALRCIPEAININPGQPTEEQGFVLIQRCMHGETPHYACEVLEKHVVPD